MVKDRLKTLAILEKYLYDKDFWANEKDQLQELVSNHFRIFWEWFELFANEEDDIKKTIIKLREKYLVDTKMENFEWKDKELDILISKTSRYSWRVDNVIVELKHPKIILWNNERNQIQEYMQIIQKQSNLNWESFFWKYILVWNEISKNSLIYTDYDTAGWYWEKHLWLISRSWNISIYVRKWCDVIAECRDKLQYLEKALNLKYSEIKNNMNIESITDAEKMLDNSAII